MKQYRYTVVLIFILSQLSLAAQDINKSKDLILKANLTSLVDYFTFPSTRISIEKKIDDYFSINAEIGAQLFKADTSGLIQYYGKGHKVNIEGRLYMAGLSDNDDIFELTGTYFAMQLFFRHNEYLTDIDYHRGGDAEITTDYFNVSKFAYGANLLIGYQVPVAEKLVIDIYAGTGILIRDIQNTNREFMNNQRDSRVNSSFLGYSTDDKHLSETSGTSLNLLAGLRVGYTIK